MGTAREPEWELEREPQWIQDGNLNGDLSGNLNGHLDGNLNGDLDRNLNGNQPGTKQGLNLNQKGVLRGSLEGPWGSLGGPWGSLEGSLGDQTGTQDWSGTGPAPGTQKVPKVYNCHQKQARGQTLRQRAGVSKIPH